MSNAYATAVQRAKSNTLIKATPLESAVMVGGAGGGLSAVSGLLQASASERQLKLYDEFKHWVYVAINAITTRVAGQPYCAGTLVGTAKSPQKTDGRKVAKRSLPISLKQMTGGGVEIEPIIDHDILDFLQTPNNVQGKAEFLATIIINLMVTGQAYVVAGKVKASDDVNGFGMEAWAVPTTAITAKHDKGKGLFSSYELKWDAQSEAMPLPKEAVCRLYFPDPKDPKGCISPMLSQLPAIKVDSAIQKSQAAMFERGIWPNVVLTVGRTPGADGKLGVRPSLNGKQRNQMVRAVRQLWKQDVTSNGDPAIVDGLIESIHKLSNTPAEMDWMQSGDQVKSRIFQAFKVNPYVVGDQTANSRAQAAVAEQTFCTQAVNPLIDMISDKLLNKFLAGLFDESETLVLWLEEASPKDEDLNLRKWDLGVRNGGASPNDYRTNVLGLPPYPDDDAADASPLLSTVGGMSGFVAILQAVGMGVVAPDSATAAFQLFFGIDEAAASALVGTTGSMGILAPAPGLPQSQQQQQQRPVDNDDEQDDLPEAEDIDEAGFGAILPKRPKGGLPSISRSAVKSSRRAAQAKREKEVAKSLLPFSQVSIGRRLLALLDSPSGT